VFATGRLPDRSRFGGVGGAAKATPTRLAKLQEAFYDPV
jgi:hypothetical protein